MTTRRRGRVGTWGALALVVSLGGAAGAGASPAQAAPHADRDLLGAVSSSRWFSPNGDGSKDSVRVGIHSTREAKVTVTVRHERKGWIARRVSFGSLRAPTKAWAWNGRNDDGRVVVDGNYVVTVVARSGGRTERDTTRVKSRRDYSAGAVESPELTVDRTTVPTGGAVAFTARQVLEARTAFGRDRLRPVLTAVTVYADSAGAAVAATFPLEHDDAGGPARVWTAPAPGTYSLVAHFTDRYGNPGTAARRITVTP